MAKTIVLVLIFGFVFLVIFLSYIPVGLWIKAAAEGVQIRVIQLIGMRLRHVDPKKIINPLILAKQAGLDLSIDKLEAQHLAGGHVDRLVQILIDAQYERIEISFEEACLIDLNGYDFNTYKEEYGLSAKL